MRRLSREYLEEQTDLGFSREVLNYPEKVIQFGTGVLLKGLPDLVIDIANKKGIFRGKIAMIKSTDIGSVESMIHQNCLYTVAIRGVENNKVIDTREICTSINRVLYSKSDWDDIIQLSKKKEIECVISNTTELGIIYAPEKIKIGICPESFTVKIVAILKSRFDHFNGDLSKGLIFLPTELIPENGTKLQNIVMRIASENSQDSAFLSWIKSANTFCNTLVDRIVPGHDPEIKLPYDDENLITVEPYFLWAIEGDKALQEKLTFCLPQSNVFVSQEIEKYKEIKLRLLNATHSFTSGLAFLCGFEMVKDAMNNEEFSDFIKQLMFNEISEAMNSSISKEEKKLFAEKVLDRFRNPFLEHKWLTICTNYSAKMTTRCLPLISSFIKNKNEMPAMMTFGFAAQLYFLKAVSEKSGKHYGQLSSESYLINDPNASIFFEIWNSETSLRSKIEKILENESIWGENINNLNSFAGEVYATLERFEQQGVYKTLCQLNRKAELI